MRVKDLALLPFIWYLVAWMRKKCSLSPTAWKRAGLGGLRVGELASPAPHLRKILNLVLVFATHELVPRDWELENCPLPFLYWIYCIYCIVWASQGNVGSSPCGCWWGKTGKPTNPSTIQALTLKKSDFNFWLRCNNACTYSKRPDLHRFHTNEYPIHW